jgi:hypothetical protein
MPSPKEIEDYAQPQIRFLELLRQLTDAGRVEWLENADEPEFIYCLVDGEDLIKFHCVPGEKGDEQVSPMNRFSGVVAHYRNTTYVWLPVAVDWDLLLQLLRLANDDAKRFVECRRIAHQGAVKALESRLKL